MPYTCCGGASTQTLQSMAVHLPGVRACAAFAPVSSLPTTRSQESKRTCTRAHIHNKGIRK